MKQWKSLYEQEYIQLYKGMHVKGGKFKNKDMEIKDFDVDEKGQPIMRTNKGNKKIYSVNIPVEDDTNINK